MSTSNAERQSSSQLGLSWLKLIQLSRVLLWRELRAGQLTIIVLALVLAVTAATVISVFSNRLDAGMLDKSTDLLGADLRVRSSQVIPEPFYQHAQALGMRTATTLEFPSMVIAGDEMTLAAVKAVDDNYPLKGNVSISQNAFEVGEKTASGPAIGEVWLESRLLALLNADIGDNVEVGRKVFRVASVITSESDRGGNFYSLSPRLMMHLSDIEGAGLIQTGSRVVWRLLAAMPSALDASEHHSAQSNPEAPQNKTREQANPEQTLSRYKDWLKPKLAAHHSIETLSDSNQALSAALDKARNYLSLAAVLAVLLSGIAIAMAAKEYAQHHFDTSALLRTLGASRKQVLRLFILQLSYLAIICSIVGLAFGTVIQSFLIDLLSGLFTSELPQASWQAWAIACVTAPFTLIGFALPHLLRLGNVSPLRILRRELEPMRWNAWAVYSLALASVFCLSIWFTHNVAMSAIIVLGGFVLLMVLMLLLQLFLKAIAKLIPTHTFSLYIRFAWQQIFRDTQSTSTQILAFSMILMVMITISIVRNDLLADWQRSLPDDAPNFFAMNIQSYEMQNYQQALSNSGFENRPLFPMIPGRLTEINGEDVQLDEERREDPALQRDLALTWSKDLPSGNKVLKGQWLKQSDADTKQVSIESRLASRLKVVMGDQLSFDVAGEIFTVTVTSIRSVDWGTLTPNFYMILSEDVLKEMPASYLTSFHVSDEQQAQLTQLIRDFPTITLLDMTMVFSQIQVLLMQVSMAIEYLLLLVLFAGLLVLMATLHTSLDERIQQGAILRTLGAKKAQLRLNQWSEFALLGLLSGIIALLGAEAICFVLYNNLLDLEYQAQWQLWLWVPLSASLVITLMGGFTTRRVSSQPPIVVLREI